MESSCLVYINLIIVTLLFALFVQKREPLFLKTPEYKSKEFARGNVAEFAIFCLLFAVSACRIAVGNDYWVYRFNFRLIAQERLVSSEAGFNTIVKGMQALFGYDNYLPIFALFSFLTVLFFSIALHDQSEDYLFSLYLLLMGGYYFNSLNSVRYYLALAIALYSMKHVLQGNYLRFFFWVLIGINFHKSIVLIVPVYLLSDWLSKQKIKKWMIAVLGLFSLSLIFCQDIYRRIIFFFYPFYEGSAFDNGSISWINLAKCLGVFALFLLCLWQGEISIYQKFYSYLNLFGFLVYCCGGFIPETSRIGYYMIVSQVFLIPSLLRSMKKGPLKILCTVAVILCFLLYFGMMLQKMYEINIRLLPYRNWIFD